MHIPLHARAYEIAIAAHLQAQRLPWRHAGMSPARKSRIFSPFRTIFSPLSRNLEQPRRALRGRARIFVCRRRASENLAEISYEPFGYPGEVTEKGSSLGECNLEMRVSPQAGTRCGNGDVSSRDYVDDRFINARCVWACVIPCFRKERFLECAHSDSYELSVFSLLLTIPTAAALPSLT